VDEPFSVLDLQRMLLGEQPVLFYVEILVRTLVVYGYALVLLRWLGSRTIGQLSTVEFLLVIALGSAVGDPMFYPDVPLLHALLVVTIVVVANRGLDMLIAGNKTAERAIDGEPVELIDGGVISKRFLRSMTLGRSEIFQQLRRRGIRNLGQVRFAFVEPDGTITVFREEHGTTDGLSIVPPWEVREPHRINAADVQQAAERLACMTCGTVRSVPAGTAPGSCPHCSHGAWTTATGGHGASDIGASLS
jgi:uncharacterized membrane protein YcaP (DUF421 family)